MMFFTLTFVFYLMNAWTQTERDILITRGQQSTNVTLLSSQSELMLSTCKQKLPYYSIL